MVHPKENYTQLPQKTESRPHDPGILLLDTCSKELKAESQRYLHTQAQGNVIHNSQVAQGIKRPSTDDRQRVSPYSGVPFRLTKKEILTQPPRQINLEDIRPREISQTQRDMYYMIPLLRAVKVMGQSVVWRLGGG